MNEIKTLAMVKNFWKHADEDLRDEFNRMHEGFRFYNGRPLIWRNCRRKNALL